MKLILTTACAVLVAGTAAAQGKGEARGQAADGTNWGELTSEAIADGFPQGAHSSDPSGDGHGPGTADEPRAGLGNVVEQGNMGATVDLIKSLLP